MVNSTPMQAIGGLKVCSRCRIEQTTDQFPRGRAWKDGLYPQCRGCVRERGAAQRGSDPDGHRAYMREYMKAWRLPQKAERKRLRELALARDFWLQVSIGDLAECWEWSGSCDPDGYGRLMRGRKVWRAHRLAWLLAYGEEPQQVIMHKCDNPPCCNPLHLSDDSDVANAHDMIAKGRAYSFGHQIKLTPERVMEIRRRSQSGETGRSIAAALGVSFATVSRVLSGKRWAHVPDT